MLEVEQATFKPLVFSSTGGMAAECNRYHINRLDQFVANGRKLCDHHVMDQAKVSFALLRSALLWLRGSRASRRVPLELSDIALDVIIKENPWPNSWIK